jgi:hypothetical protein
LIGLPKIKILAKKFDDGRRIQNMLNRMVAFFFVGLAVSLKE